MAQGFKLSIFRKIQQKSSHKMTTRSLLRMRNMKRDQTTHRCIVLFRMTQRWTAAAVCHMSWFLFFTHYTNKIHSSSHSLLGKTSHKSRQKTQLTSCSEIFSPEESFPPRIWRTKLTGLPPSWWWRFPDLNGRCWGMLGLFPRSLFRMFPKWMCCLDVCRISDVFGCYFLLLVEWDWLNITMKKITNVEVNHMAWCYLESNHQKTGNGKISESTRRFYERFLYKISDKIGVR